MNILTIRIDSVDMTSAIQKAEEFMAGDGQHTIFTPNPEMIVDAQRDVYFKQVLNSGSLNLCDGFGLQLVSKGKLKRIPGIDFCLALCERAAQQGKSVFLLGASEGTVIKKAAENLKNKFPKLRIVGYTNGPVIGQTVQQKRLTLRLNEEENNELIAQIVMARPDIIFVGFGHGKQEKWIAEHLVELPSVCIAMGVGGAFDMWGGKVRRAPQVMRKIGLEWLWRLLQEPWRIKRIWKATGRFLFLYYFRYGSERGRRPRTTKESDR